VALLPVICLTFLSATALAQDCPPNIDFETGTFDGWTCYTGHVAYVNGQNVISITPSGPVYDRHTMYTANTGTIQTDPYGGFSVNCPNGSNHSIRLGNDQGGGGGRISAVERLAVRVGPKQQLVGVDLPMAVENSLTS